MAVIIYTTPTCEWSTKAKAHLKKKKRGFEEKDLTEDKPARKEMIDISGQMGTPVLQIGSAIIVGYNPKLIDDALSKIE
ncbi:NrdH-redoxin [archaeon]|jgi:glutaredoxin 3|nr:NrdH-redoxin [archaeon]MBT6761430.1 NrdH-redoxin [archaeon]